MHYRTDIIDEELDTLAGTIPATPDLSVYTLTDGTRAFSGPQSMGSNKLTSVAAGTADTDAVNKGQFVEDINIQIMPGDTFFAWGTETIADAGLTGVKVVIDPTDITNIATATSGKTLSIRTVQVTNEGVTDATADYDAAGDFIHMKVDFTDGDDTFAVACFRTSSSPSEPTCIVRWFVVGQLV